MEAVRVLFAGLGLCVRQEGEEWERMRGGKEWSRSVLDYRRAAGTALQMDDRQVG